jgi:hypothetical protein
MKTKSNVYAAWQLLLVPALLFILFGQAAVAQDISPSNGAWVITEETDGKPGRGLNLITAGNTLIMALYGYDESGEAKWWTGVGILIAGSNQLTFPLNEYAGGMAFGDPPKSAEYVGTGGDVTLKFTSFTEGEICLPKESCKAMQQLGFGYIEGPEELLGTWAFWRESLMTGIIKGSGVDFFLTGQSGDSNFSGVSIGIEYYHDASGVGENLIDCYRLTETYKATFSDPPDYYCEVSRSDELLAAFFMKFNRNGFHSLDADPNYVFRGTRLTNDDGRQVIAD